jgi:hypothetical protein
MMQPVINAAIATPAPSVPMTLEAPIAPILLVKAMNEKPRF